MSELGCPYCYNAPRIENTGKLTWDGWENIHVELTLRCMTPGCPGNKGFVVNYPMVGYPEDVEEYYELTGRPIRTNNIRQESKYVQRRARFGLDKMVKAPAKKGTMGRR